jgi:hypothetical protein
MAHYVSLQEAAHHFGVSTEGLRLAITGPHGLPGVLRVGRVYRLDLDVLTEHFSQAVGQPSARAGLAPRTSPRRPSRTSARTAARGS